MRLRGSRTVGTAAAFLSLLVVLAVAAGIGLRARSGIEPHPPPAVPSSTQSMAPPTPLPDSPAPLLSDLAWTAHPFPDPAADIRGIASAGGRLMAVGGTLDGYPWSWYSDDGGVNWLEGGVYWRMIPEDFALDPMFTVAAFGDRLLGLAETDDGVLVWASIDRGDSFHYGGHLANDLVSLSAGPMGYLAVGTEESTDTGPTGIVWLAPFGRDWQQDSLGWHRIEDPSFRSARIRGVAQGNGVVVLVGDIVSGDQSVPAIWRSTDLATWDRVALEAGRGSGFAVAWRDGAGFLAAGVRYGVGGAAAWRSAGGLTWSGVDLASDTDADVGTHVIAGDQGWLVIGEIPRVFERSYVWRVAADGSAAAAQEVIPPVLAAVAHQDGYVGIASCGPTAECVRFLAFVRPLEAAPPPAPEIYPTPFVDPPMITGEFLVAMVCSFLRDESGQLWEMRWPDGYSVDRDQGGELVLFGPGGTVAARIGDVVTVMGAAALDQGSFCMVGPIYRASEIVEIKPP